MAKEVEKQQTFREYQVDIFRAEREERGQERAQTGVKMHERDREKGDVFISEWCHSIPTASGFLAFPFKAPNERTNQGSFKVIEISFIAHLKLGRAAERFASHFHYASFPASVEAISLQQSLNAIPDL